MRYFYKSPDVCDNMQIEMYISDINFNRFNWHRQMELFILLKGSVSAYIDGKGIGLDEGDVLLIPANRGHAMYAEEAGACALVLHFLPSVFAQPGSTHTFDIQCISTSGTRNDANFCRVRRYSSQMMLAAVSQQPAQRFMLHGAFLMLLGTLLGEFPQRPAMSEDTPAAKSRRTIVKVINYLEKNFSVRLSLDDAARVAGYNRSYFSTYFRKCVGIRFYDYLTRIRFRHALHLLSSTDRSITDIAIECGFPDLKTFTAYYKKNFHTVPSQRRSLPESSPYRRLAVQERIYIEVGTPDIDAKLRAYAGDFGIF